MSTKDETAKNFWAKQIPVLILKFAAQASECEKTEETSEQRAESYTLEYQEEVDVLMKKLDKSIKLIKFTSNNIESSFLAKIISWVFECCLSWTSDC